MLGYTTQVKSAFSHTLICQICNWLGSVIILLAAEATKSRINNLISHHFW